MVTLQTFIQRVDTLKTFIEKEFKHILVNESDQVVNMIQEQHHAGQGSDDKTMQTGYSSGYTKRRKKKGLQTRYVDLHFSGKYHKGLKVKPAEDGVDVESNVEYEEYIRERFGTAVGLTSANAKQISEIVANILTPKIKKHLVK